MLDTRRLLVLREVAAHGSVSGAAEALGYTPSAVSQQLGALERETGRALVERHGRGIRADRRPRGMLLPHAHDVLAALERADAALAAQRVELHRHASGSPRSRPRRARCCPPRSPRCAQTHPRLRVDLTELEPHESLPALALGRIDVAVAHEYDLVARDAARDLRRREILREPVLLAERDELERAGAALSWPTTPQRDWIVAAGLDRRAASSCAARAGRPASSRGSSRRPATSGRVRACRRGRRRRARPAARRLPSAGSLRSLTRRWSGASSSPSRAGSDDHPLIRAVVDGISSRTTGVVNL